MFQIQKQKREYHCLRKSINIHTYIHIIQDVHQYINPRIYVPLLILRATRTLVYSISYYARHAVHSKHVL